MPQLGETVIEGTVTKWLKKEGETVARDEPLFEISTDKVDTEVPSPLEGTLVQIKVQEGETVAVGTELAMIDTGDGSAAGDGAAAAEPATSAEPQATPPAEAAATEAPAPAEERSPEVPAASAEPAAEPAPTTTAAPPAADGSEDGDQRAVLSPLVRRLAEQNNVDLSKVTGTGTGGRIMKSDVEAFINSGGAGTAPAAEAPTAPAEAPPAPAEAPPAEAPPVAAPPVAPAAEVPPAAPPAPAAPQVPVVAGEGEELVELSRMRQAIGHHMVASLQTSARAWSLVEVNMENIVRLRAQVKDTFKEREGVGLTYMPFIAKAVCDALMAHPTVNAELRGEQLVVKNYVNLGIAVALDDGLIVPVVKGADSMSVGGLAKAINDVATRARGKQLKPDEVHGSTFTITNPGPYGTLMSVPIINQPNCAILALDTIEKRPVVIDDAIAIRHMVYLSMSWDHRIIDGATAAQFLARLRENLETWDFGPEFGLAPRG
jgi:2-oxoglutarate dehydrogenase E2 component (dihydrolipoamide succinyltransferase)